MSDIEDNRQVAALVDRNDPSSIDTTETVTDAPSKNPGSSSVLTKSSNTSPSSEIPQGIVLYTDGGCGPTNPGFIGYGFHGYLYKAVAPKKGAGIATVVLTKDGYLSKSNPIYSATEQVTPISYLDAIGSSGNFGTNNTAELAAVSSALEKAKDYTIARLLMVCDSEYVLNGITKWSKSWISNNWIKRDGEPVPHKGIWLELLNHLAVLKTRGIVVDFVWVRGHGDGTNNSFGNIVADKKATIGKAYSAAGQTRFMFEEKTSDGYWKTDVEKHPLIGHRSMYYSTNKDTHVPGEYFLGNQSKENELLGKKVSDGAYAVIQLAEPDPVLEFIRTYVSENTGEYEKLIRSHLENVFNTEVYDELLTHGGHFLNRYKPNSYNLRTTLCKSPIADVLDPPLIAVRAFDCVGSLKSILMAYRFSELKQFGITDITDVLYTKELVEKKKKMVTEITLKPEYNVGYSALAVNVNVCTENGPVVVPITMTLGIDIPHRNTFKRIEDESTKVVVLTWLDSPDVFRYATIVQSKDDYSIWAGQYSNLVVLHEAMINRSEPIVTASA